MVFSAARYRRALKRALHCGGNARRELLAKFDLSLSTFLEDHPAPTDAELSAAFGTPEEMARVMMEGVGEEEKARYYRGKRVVQALAGVVVILYVLFSLYIFIEKEIPVEIYHSCYEVTTTPTEEAP